MAENKSRRSRQDAGLLQRNPENPGQPRAAQQDTIDLVELFYRLLDSWKLLLIAMAVCILALLGFKAVKRDKPMYQASSTIYVIGTDTTLSLADLQISSNMMNDYLKVFDIWEVHDMVRRNLDLKYNYKQLRESVSVVNPASTRMLDITVSSESPEEAADMANEYAVVVSNYIADTMKTDKPSIMSVALVPTNPYNIHNTRDLILAAIVGLLIGAAIVTFQMLTDDKIKTAEDIMRYTGLSNLAIVPVEETLADRSIKPQHAGKGRLKS